MQSDDSTAKGGSGSRASIIRWRKESNDGVYSKRLRSDMNGVGEVKPHQVPYLERKVGVMERRVGFIENTARRHRRGG